MDVDATIVVAHSEKELASPTFKKTFGYHPIGVWCDNTGEFLAAALRTGRAGSNTAPTISRSWARRSPRSRCRIAATC